MFLFNIDGNEIPKIGEYVNYRPELWKLYPRLPRSVPSGIISFADLESVYANTSSTSQYSVPYSADSSGTAKPVLAIRKVEEYKIFTSKRPRRVLTKTGNRCEKTDKEAIEKIFGKWSAECEALRNNLNAAAAKKAVQEQSVDLSKY